MSSTRKNLTASEIGTYAFCPRAWALKKLGYPPDNRQALDEGTAYHHSFGMREHAFREAKVMLILIMLCAAALILRYFLK